MLVKNWLKEDIVTVDAEGSLLDAANLMKSYDQALIPVMEKGYLLGVVTDQNLKKAVGAQVFLEKGKTLKDIAPRVENIIERELHKIRSFCLELSEGKYTVC